MILVTGATGNVGAHLISELCGQGAPVRALVRSQEKADSLRGYDCSIAIGSYEQPDSLRHALHDVDTVFLVAPVGERMADQAIALIDAAAGGGGVRVVQLAAAGVDGPSADRLRLLREHARVSAHLEQAGVPTTVLAPTSFFQNLLRNAAQVQEQSVLATPGADVPITYVDTRDVAAVAAHVLTSQGHEGATYTVSGPGPLTRTQLAAAMSQALGRDVRPVDVPLPEARQDMAAAGIPAWNVEALMELWESQQSGDTPVTDEVTKATGRPARSVSDFLHDHLVAFR